MKVLPNYSLLEVVELVFLVGYVVRLFLTKTCCGSQPNLCMANLRPVYCKLVSVPDDLLH